MGSQTKELPSSAADVNEGSAGPDSVRREPFPHVQIDRLTDQIKDHAVRETMSAAFSSLLHLLKDVPQFASLGRNETPAESQARLEEFRVRASSLVDFIRTVAKTTVATDEVLSETLDGIAFALGHDIRRSFESELKTLNGKFDDEFAKGKIAYVGGLLTNCLQQSVITLAQVFDPGLDGGKLFDNYQARLRESLLLCRDLADMVQLVRACDKDLEQNYPRLVERINGFRGESMQFLMYKDWQEFESLSESLLAQTHETTEIGSPIHSFLAYLETLLGQVKLRAVLVDVFCDFFPEGEQTDQEWGEAQHRLAFELYRSELTSMLERSIEQ